MEAKRPRPLPLDPAWTAVRSWPEPMRGESKLAWRYLYELAGCRRDRPRVLVTAAAIGLDQGRTHASGLRALMQLAGCGLIDIIDRNSGRFDIAINDPLIVAKARLSRAVSDGQAGLFHEQADAPQSPPEGPNPSPPRPEEAVDASQGCQPGRAGDFLRHPVADVTTHPRSLASESIGERRSLKHHASEASDALDACGRGCGDTSATDVAADLARAYVEHHADPALRAARCEKLMALIREHVGDQATRTTPLLRIAWAVVNGDFPEEKLMELIARAKKRAKSSKAAYLIGALKRMGAYGRGPE